MAMANTRTIEDLLDELSDHMSSEYGDIVADIMKERPLRDLMYHDLDDIADEIKENIRQEQEEFEDDLAFLNYEWEMSRL